MKKFKVRNLIFSSSAAVYGKKNRIIKESSPKILIIFMEKQN